MRHMIQISETAKCYKCGEILHHVTDLAIVIDEEGTLKCIHERCRGPYQIRVEI